MDYQSEFQEHKSLSQFIRSQFVKRVIAKLILSVSVFSLLFSNSTLLSLLHYFNFYFSTLPIKLFSHTLDKNCTFLLCNGLLVFLAKYSGLFSSSSSSRYNLTNHESFKNYEGDSQSHMMMETTDQLPLLEKEAVVENTDQTQQNAMERRENSEYKSEETLETEAEKFTEEKHEEQGGEGQETGDVLEENIEEPEVCFSIQEPEEEEEEEENEREEEEENGMLSTEELNKKFDDFIRKMKEELRIEARQQLIMV